MMFLLSNENVFLLSNENVLIFYCLGNCSLFPITLYKR